MFDIVDTAFSYERELIVCSFLQDFSKGKGSSLQLICNAHTAFLLCVLANDLIQSTGKKLAFVTPDLYSPKAYSISRLFRNASKYLL